jgi:hypothetical protein
METEVKLNGNMDALDWAKEFVRLNNNGTFKDGIDEGLMLGWFANAIMTGFDEGTRRSQQHPPRENGGEDE